MSLRRRTTFSLVSIVFTGHQKDSRVKNMARTGAPPIVNDSPGNSSARVTEAGYLAFASGTEPPRSAKRSRSTDPKPEGISNEVNDQAPSFNGEKAGSNPVGSISVIGFVAFNSRDPSGPFSASPTASNFLSSHLHSRRIGTLLRGSESRCSRQKYFVVIARGCETSKAAESSFRR